MSSLHPAESGRPSGLAAAFGSSVMEQLAAAFAAATGARSAWLERPVSAAGEVEVLAAFGPDSPHPGRREPGSAEVPPDTLVLPLLLAGEQVGKLVAAGVDVTRRPEPAQLELLGVSAALAVRNADLERQLEITATAATERHYRLIRGTAHHLKDVLGVASEYTQLLDMDSVLTSRQQEYIEASRRNVDTAVRLITELLDLGRVESGRMPVEWGPVDVRMLVRGMLRDYQRTHADRQLTIATQLEDRLPLIHSDLDMLRRVLDTVLSNAFKYAPARSTITVGATARTGRRAGDPRSWLCVTVADEGPGVAEREDVFEEVSRVELCAGPGFRLAICRRLARLLGGDLTLDSPAGPGSTFTLWLPTATPPPEAAASAEPGTP